jgi:multimeric flavodoxin WrbA
MGRRRPFHRRAASLYNRSMNVIAINGSPRPDGNCSRALAILGERLAESGIGLEVVNVGGAAIRGCIACGSCAKTGRCAFGDDQVNATVERMAAADGIVLASPVYFSGVAGTMKCFCDRAFYVAGAAGNLFRHKAGAALVAVRRSGGSSTLDGLNHYLTYSEMIVATSRYWNIVHGRAKGEMDKDAEGVQIVEVLGDNLAWILKTREASRQLAPEPQAVPKVFTNFVR